MHGAEKRISEFKNTGAESAYRDLAWPFISTTAQWVAFPDIGGRRIISTDYVSFIEKVEEGKVRDVVLKDDQIYFTADDDGKTLAYRTGEPNDPQLVDRLLNAQSPNEVR